MKVKLAVVGGRKAGMEIPISTPTFVIGRDAHCHLRPQSNLVGQIHCQISVGNGSVAIEDGSNASGTFVNGEKIKWRRNLKGGDRIKVGPLEFEMRIAQEVGEEAAARKARGAAVSAARSYAREYAVAPHNSPGGLRAACAVSRPLAGQTGGRSSTRAGPQGPHTECADYVGDSDGPRARGPHTECAGYVGGSDGPRAQGPHTECADYVGGSAPAAAPGRRRDAVAGRQSQAGWNWLDLALLTAIAGLTVFLALRCLPVVWESRNVICQVYKWPWWVWSVICASTLTWLLKMRAQQQA